MFRNIYKEKELIDRELEIYRKEKLAEITLEIAKAQEDGARQEREYECAWHERREKLNTELAVLEAKKDSYVSTLEERNANYEKQYHAVNSAREKTIEVLESSLKTLIEKRYPNRIL